MVFDLQLWLVVCPYHAKSEVLSITRGDWMCRVMGLSLPPFGQRPLVQSAFIWMHQEGVPKFCISTHPHDTSDYFTLLTPISIIFPTEKL